jgi:hypothetical protein
MLALLSVVLLALVSTTVLAQTGVYASGVVRGKYLYNTDDDIDASVADTRVEIDIGVGALTLGAVYRAYLLSDEGYNPADVEASPTEIKHRYAALDHEELSIRAGHFFATFGHGLTMRSYENVDLEHDTVLDGLMADYAVGDISLTALTGIATDDAAGTAYTEHVVRAARAAAPFTEWAEVAGSVVERSRTARDEDVELPDEIARFEDTVVGTELSVWAGPLTVAAEYAGRDGENPVTKAGEVQGHATYAAATLSFTPITLFGEFKDYEDFDHMLVNPPTAVRDHLWTLMNRATYQIDLNDERGFLVEASAPVAEAFFLMGGASEARNHDGDLRHWEMFGQLDWAAGSSTAYLGAARSREYLFSGGEAAGKFTEHTTVGVTVELGFASAQMVELTAEGQSTDDPDGKSYNDYIVSAAYYPGLDMTIIATAERTTADTGGRDSWFIAEARKLLADDFEVSLSAGTERGGKKCTGGVCFIEPEFEGVRLRFTRFF